MPRISLENKYLQSKDESARQAILSCTKSSNGQVFEHLISNENLKFIELLQLATDTLDYTVNMTFFWRVAKEQQSLKKQKRNTPSIFALCISELQMLRKCRCRC